MSIIDFIESVAVQTAVYWGTPVDNGYGGFTYADPIEILCRWEGSTKLITDAKGQQIVCVAEVMVLQELDIDGLLYLGSLDDLDSAQEDDPSTITGSQRIKQFMKTPLFASDDEFVYISYL
jgi:hypothetical protein